MFKSGYIINGRYEVREQIGSGGGGIIYKAYDSNMQKDVAVKLIKNASAEALENRNEIDLMKNLKSKYLPVFYDFVQNGDEVYTVMEYIDGHDIKRLIEMGKTFNEDEIIRCGIQLCDAASELHSKHPPIIHGDIKPANVMLTPTGDICLIDFNISAIMQGNKAAVKGYSKEYAAPEQTFTSKNYKQYVEKPIEDEFHEETRFLLNENMYGSSDASETSAEEKSRRNEQAFIDVRTDIYGIGAVLYYMLTGHSPVDVKNGLSAAKASSAIKNIISVAMDADPDKRYSTANEMKNALVSKTGENSRSDTASSKNKKLIVGLTCAAVVVAAVGGSIAFGGKKNSDEIASVQTSASETATVSINETETVTKASSEVSITETEPVTETESAVTAASEAPVADGYARLCAADFSLDINTDYIKGFDNNNDPVNDCISLTYCLDNDSYSNLDINYVKNAVDSQSGYDVDVPQFLSNWIQRNLDNTETPADYQIIDEHTETINGRECGFLEINFYVDNEELNKTICVSFMLFGFVQDRDICILRMSGTASTDYGGRFDESLWERKYITGLYKLADTINIGSCLDPENIPICRETFSPSVTSLDLSGKKLSYEDLFYLSCLKNLKALNLADSNFSDVKILSSLSLEKLDLSGTKVDSLYYLNTESLKILDLSNTKVDHILLSSDMGTENIEYLNLKDSNIESLGYGNKYTNLKGLIMSDRSNSFFLYEFASEYDIPELNFLVLDGITVSSNDVKHFDLPKVKKLFMTSTGLDDSEAYRGLPVTEELYIGGNDLSDKDIEKIQSYVNSNCKVYSDNDYDIDNPPYNFPEVK